MAVTKKHVTLCQEGNKDVEYYPNIESENIPNKAISENQLNDNLQEKLNRTYPDVYNKAETDALLLDKADKSTTYTKTETDALLLDKADKNNIPFENIKDADGHNRFVEGDITTTDLTGLTYDYARWSLSGTHLMLVIAGKIEDGVTIPDNFNYGVADIPEWMSNKIYPSYFGSYIEFKTITARSTSSWKEKDYAVRLGKVSGDLKVTKNNATENDTGVTLGFRIQFDLLIDNE